MNVLRKIYGWSSGFGLSVSILFFMFVITWLGTLSQAEIGLFQSQKRYFESFALVERVGPVPIPLPGGALVMGLLAVNLVVGGLARLRRGWATAMRSASSFRLRAGAVRGWPIRSTT